MNEEETGHHFVTIKIKNEQQNWEACINFIDLIGFDQSFTQRIMNGETSIHEDSTFDRIDAT